ncbi:unnamed protein product [Fraxinus pennsylvanica]|uniref:Uncharacterized protein n=1 Tax=Fraxinus pennsylvanica TaxID=56036 RepID=A0AAD2E3S8_9LAMI|nr:unnamed protein product [Fraxinus pennsylvanica]
MATISIPLSPKAFSGRQLPTKCGRPTPRELHLPFKIRCSSIENGFKSVESSTQFKELRNVACGVLAVWAVTAASPVIAANQVKVQEPCIFNLILQLIEKNIWEQN